METLKENFNLFEKRSFYRFNQRQMLSRADKFAKHETMEWWNGGMVEWWNGGMVEWWNGGMVEWWNGRMVEWWNGRMVEW